jgi:hypothetical protein
MGQMCVDNLVLLKLSPYFMPFILKQGEKTWIYKPVFFERDGELFDLNAANILIVGIKKSEYGDLVVFSYQTLGQIPEDYRCPITQN